MKRTPSSLLLLMFLFLPSVAVSQGPPVTVGECNKALDRVDAAIRKVLKMPAARASTDLADKPVTRAEVIARLDAMFESYRPSFKYTPRPFTTVPEVARQYNKDAKTVARIVKLSRFGCIGPVGPLVVGPGENISVQALGDAVGYFLSQIAALTYTADPKWTPALQPPGGGL